jgi:CheY-like chemotaxis protein
MTALKIPVPYAPSILLVEDEEETRHGFRRALEEIGYYVVETGSGRQARSAAEERFFDLMILDLSMPDVDGIELIGTLRAELPLLRVLAISGFMSGSFLQIAKKLGASSTLQKPVAEDRLVVEMCKLLAFHS